MKIRRAQVLVGKISSIVRGLVTLLGVNGSQTVKGKVTCNLIVPKIIWQICMEMHVLIAFV